MLALLVTIRQFWRAVRAAWRDPAFRSLAALISILLAVGTLFYHQIEGWGWLDSFYFCVITLATVGYGDFSPKTAGGKIFTIVYIVIGIGVLLSVLTRLAEALLASREEARSQHLQRFRRRSARFARPRRPREPK